MRWAAVGLVWLVGCAAAFSANECPISSCGTGTVLDSGSGSCEVAPTASPPPCPTQAAYDDGYNAGANSVPVVTCGSGTYLDTDNSTCLPDSLPTPGCPYVRIANVVELRRLVGYDCVIGPAPPGPCASEGWDSPECRQCLENAFTQEDAALYGPNISSWNTSVITDMRYLAFGPDFNADLSGWDTGRVVTMAGMFIDAISFNADLSGWDTSRVTDMSYMFSGATWFNGDLSGWDTSQVTNMNYMFYSALKFNGDLSGWDTSRVTNMISMFYNATSFNGTLSRWNTGSLTSSFSAISMFEHSGMQGECSRYPSSDAISCR